MLIILLNLFMLLLVICVSDTNISSNSLFLTLLKQVSSNGFRTVVLNRSDIRVGNDQLILRPGYIEITPYLGNYKNITNCNVTPRKGWTDEDSAALTLNVLSDYTSFPFLAALRWDDSATICSGSVISHWHILTAAHCVIFKETGHQREARRLSVRLGSKFASSGGFVYIVRRWFVPLNYNRMQRSHNIAVLETNVFIEFSETIDQVAVASPLDTITFPNLVEQRTPCLQIGFGQPQIRFQEAEPGDPVPRPDYLYKGKDSEHHVGLNLMHWSECSAQSSKYNSQFDSKYELCTGRNDEHKICLGDPGGPLIVQGKQYGVISKAIGCNSRHGLDIYTRVDAFYDFIMESMNRREIEMQSPDHSYKAKGNTPDALRIISYSTIISVFIIFTA